MTELDELVDTEDVPVVIADHNGIITRVNNCFEKTFRWNRADLLGQLLTVIMPPKYHDSHSMGFSRFVTSKVRNLPAHALDLDVVCGDGKTLPSEHTILTAKKNSEWLFVGKIIPRDVN